MNHETRQAKDLRALQPLGQLLAEERDGLGRSLSRFGWLAPAIITPAGLILDGAERVALVEPESDVPVVIHETRGLARDGTLAARFALNRHRGTLAAPHVIALVQRLAGGRTPQRLARLLGIPLAEATVLLAAATERPLAARATDDYTEAWTIDPEPTA